MLFQTKIALLISFCFIFCFLQTQQRLLEERTRTQILNEEHRVMEETLERLRSFVTLLAEERSTFRWT